MAATSITNTCLTFNEASVMPTAAAVDATDGAKVDFTHKEDGRILIVLENAANAEKTATVKAGDGIQGVADLSVTLAANAVKCLTVESGRYMNSNGYVIIKGTDANVKVAVIELP